MTMGRGGIGLVGLLMTAATSGCGPSSSNSAGAKGASAPAPAVAAIPNACDVLSEAIAKKYLGPDAVLKRKAQPNPKMTQCQYGSDKGIITVMVGPWSMVYDASPDDKTVTGLGDEAHDSFSGLYVRKGDRGVEIDVMVASGEFWGKAADDVEAQTTAAEHKVAPDIIAGL